MGILKRAKGTVSISTPGQTVTAFYFTPADKEYLLYMGLDLTNLSSGREVWVELYFLTVGATYERKNRIRFAKVPDINWYTLRDILIPSDTDIKVAIGASQAVDIPYVAIGVLPDTRVEEMIIRGAL